MTLPLLPMTKTPKVVTLPSARAAPSTVANSSTISAGIVFVVGDPS